MNISGDWLEVNRALNPAKLWQGQYGDGGVRGGRQWLGPGISEAFVLGLTKLCRHTVLPQCCPVETAHQPIGGTCKAEDREAGNGDERKGENMRGRLGRRRGGWKD